MGASVAEARRAALDIHHGLKRHVLNNADAFVKQFDMTPAQIDEFERYIKSPLRIYAKKAADLAEHIPE